MPAAFFMAALVNLFPSKSANAIFNRRQLAQHPLAALGVDRECEAARNPTRGSASMSAPTQEVGQARALSLGKIPLRTNS